MGRRSRSMGGHKSSGDKKIQKTKRRKRDLDQIYDETQPDKLDKTVTKLTQFD